MKCKTQVLINWRY